MGLSSYGFRCTGNCASITYPQHCLRLFCTPSRRIGRAWGSEAGDSERRLRRDAGESEPGEAPGRQALAEQRPDGRGGDEPDGSTSAESHAASDAAQVSTKYGRPDSTRPASGCTRWTRPSLLTVSIPHAEPPCQWTSASQLDFHATGPGRPAARQ